MSEESNMDETKNGTGRRERQRRRTAQAASPERELPPATPEDRAAALAVERDEMKDRMLRVAAEFENWKKRARKEQTDAVASARESVLRDMLEVVDNLERAAGAQAKGGDGAVDGAAVMKGVSLVLRLFQQKLERYEVKPFEVAGPAVRPARARGGLARRERRRAVGRGRGRAAEGLPRRRAPAAPGAGLGLDRARSLNQNRPRASLPADYYQTLDVDRGATEVEIKAAYRRLALRWHPDRNPGDAAAEERFKELSIAYAVLSDEEKRGHYDRFGAVDGAGPLGGADIASATEFFDALFGDLFGLARRRKTAGRDMRYTLEVDFEEAALGCEKTITFERPEDCRACLGTGAEGASAGLATCTHCDGEGIVRKKAGFLTTRRECMGCGGTGQVPRVRCAACEGAGLVDRERSYTVRVPPGSIGGSTQRLPREGAPGAARRPVRRPARPRARAPASVLRPRVDARRGGPDRRAAAHLRRGDAGGGGRRAGARRARADARAARARRRAPSSGCAARGSRAPAGAATPTCASPSRRRPRSPTRRASS